MIVSITVINILSLHDALPIYDGEFKALVDKLVANGGTIVSELRDRINVTKMQAIATGKVEYDDNNVKVNIDFTEDMAEEHKSALTGDETWATPEQDGIGDSIARRQQY